jgi:Transposase IS116/IS110/IS902 family
MRVDLLQSIPGVGQIMALTWALEVGEVGRFHSVSQAWSYCGLTAAFRESADKQQRGPISKQRNAHLQTALIEAAKLAPQWNPALAQVHERELQREHHNRATLTVARKLVAYLMAVDSGPFNPLPGIALRLTRKSEGRPPSPLDKSLSCMSSMPAWRPLRAWWRAFLPAERRDFSSAARPRQPGHPLRDHQLHLGSAARFSRGGRSRWISRKSSTMPGYHDRCLQRGARPVHEFYRPGADSQNHQDHVEFAREFLQPFECDHWKVNMGQRPPGGPATTSSREWLTADTGHLLLGGCDPMQIISDYFPRLTEIHLKDTYARYRVLRRQHLYSAAGAAQEASVYHNLGGGGVDFPAPFKLLLDRHFKGWAISDLDGPRKGDDGFDAIGGNLDVAVDDCLAHNVNCLRRVLGVKLPPFD